MLSVYFLSTLLIPSLALAATQLGETTFHFHTHCPHVNELVKNKNQIWDTGSFLNRTQPEKVFHHEEEFIIRANWILEEKIIAK